MIAIEFPPLRSSGAVQMRDLVEEFCRKGHQVTCLIPSSNIVSTHIVESQFGAKIIRVKTPSTKRRSKVVRALSESLTPLFVLRYILANRKELSQFDGVIWYSPSIFLGPVARYLKKLSGCRAYLIVRDIFPEWAVDMGLMSRGIAYKYFKAVANYQYATADVIGIQTEGNAGYFSNWKEKPGCRIEVLRNWLTDSPIRKCSINIRKTKLARRKIFVYAGNMGVAQGASELLKLAILLKERSDVGFVFVGRGSDVPALKRSAELNSLDNVLFYDEIDAEEIPGLYAQCDVGLVVLDPRHKSHNIPGKFISYMRFGLPVLAKINPGNDLIALIENEKVGKVYAGTSILKLSNMAVELLECLSRDSNYPDRCRLLADSLFSPQVAVSQIAFALRS